MKVMTFRTTSAHNNGITDPVSDKSKSRSSRNTNSTRTIRMDLTTRNIRSMRTSERSTKVRLLSASKAISAHDEKSDTVSIQFHFHSAPMKNSNSSAKTLTSHSKENIMAKDKSTTFIKPGWDSSRADSGDAPKSVPFHNSTALSMKLSAVMAIKAALKMMAIAANNSNHALLDASSARLERPRGNRFLSMHFSARVSKRSMPSVTAT
mmetsp:Transcript_16399/g.37816  ORF Transcript_16399/g.37816 Transcript_16399/m.37816 type:complete len:208 (-) Transcript_16399:675-1298(-)